MVAESPENTRLLDVWPNLRKSGEDFAGAVKAIPEAPSGFYDAFLRSKDTFQFAIVCARLGRDLFSDARAAFDRRGEDEFRKRCPKMRPKVGERLPPAKQALLRACAIGSGGKKRKR